ncbi:MAG: hypothetical protein EBR82_76195 [Caulobacteraceae bacterium]|nr:hypothetical protein [Caulobacteraceae bacterium]
MAVEEAGRGIILLQAIKVQMADQAAVTEVEVWLQHLEIRHPQRLVKVMVVVVLALVQIQGVAAVAHLLLGEA